MGATRELLLSFWNEDEHKWLAERAADAAGVGRIVRLAPDYTVPLGDVCALADFYHNVDDLLAAAAKPGPGMGTRDEIEFARAWKISSDREFGEEFAAALREKYGEAAVATEARYLALLSDNYHHFLRSGAETVVDPELREELNIVDGHENAWIAYSNMHRRAMGMALRAHVNKDKGLYQEALAVESFGLHFLTDSFSGGHIRVPRATIEVHWNAISPMFGDNMVGLIAQILSQNLEMYGLPPAAIFQLGAYKQVEEAFPPFTLGSLVSGAYHDSDHVIRARSGGEEMTLFSDSNFQSRMVNGAVPDASIRPEERPQVERITEACALGLRHVRAAWETGDLGMDGGLPLIQTMLPEALEDLIYTQDTIDELLAYPPFQAAIAEFFEHRATELRDVVASLNDDKVEAIFNDKIFPLLLEQPIEAMRQIVDWTPDVGGWLFRRQSANAKRYVKKARDEGALDTLTLGARERLIEHLGKRRDKWVDMVYDSAPADQQAALRERFDFVGDSDRGK